MEHHLKIIGAFLIVLGLAHSIFPKYFNWKIELKQLSLVNRQMVYVHTFFIALLLILVGMLCISSSEELITTNLGKKISFGIGIFWLLRLVIQFFGYSAKLWKGKLFETLVHITFSFFWAYMMIVFFTIYLN